MDIEIEKFRPVTQCKAINNAKTDPTRYNSSYANATVTLYGIKSAREAAEKARLEDIATHEANISNIEFNKAQRIKITELMTAAGIPSTYKIPDPKSRARFPKMLVKSAGYYEDFMRNSAVADGFEYATTQYENIIGKLKKQEDALNLANASMKVEQEKEKARRSDNILLLKLIIKYSLPDDSSWGDVLEHLLDQDKYLKLAYSMYRVRSNWNDGCDPVDSALGEFDNQEYTGENDLEISKCVSRAINNFHDDRDGRIFRDCQWNYSDLYSLVDHELYVDYNLIIDKSPQLLY